MLEFVKRGVDTEPIFVRHEMYLDRPPKTFWALLPQSSMFKVIEFCADSPKLIAKLIRHTIWNLRHILSYLYNYSYGDHNIMAETVCQELAQFADDKSTLFEFLCGRQLNEKIAVLYAAYCATDQYRAQCSELFDI